MLLFYGTGFTNGGKYDKIRNMKNCNFFSNARRAGCAIRRRAIAFCVLLAYLFSLSAYGMEIPQNIKRIEDGAFIGNTGLKDVEIPASVTFIGKEAFADCTNLKEIKIHGKNIIFGDNALGRLGEDRIIVGHMGSSVERFAELYGFDFEPIVTKAGILLEYADTLVGRSYSEMDCVGFVNKCFREALGMSTGAVTTNNEDGRFPNAPNFGKLNRGLKITEIEDLQPGDIICWKNDDVTWCTHVGIYVGAGVVGGKSYDEGVFIDSSSSKGSVGYRLIPAKGSGYYTRNFMHAWRIIDY